MEGENRGVCWTLPHAGDPSLPAYPGRAAVGWPGGKMGIPLACFFRRSRVFAEECNGAISIFIPGRSPSLLRILEAPSTCILAQRRRRSPRAATAASGGAAEATFVHAPHPVQCVCIHFSQKMTTSEVKKCGVCKHEKSLEYFGVKPNGVTNACCIACCEKVKCVHGCCRIVMPCVAVPNVA